MNEVRHYSWEDTRRQRYLHAEMAQNLPVKGSIKTGPIIAICCLRNLWRIRTIIVAFAHVRVPTSPIKGSKSQQAHASWPSGYFQWQSPTRLLRSAKLNNIVVLDHANEFG
jgi:hypothetical protein